MIARAIKYVAGTFTPRRVRGADATEIGTDTATGIVKYFAGASRQLVDDWNTQTVGGAKTFSGSIAFTGATAGVRRGITVQSAAAATVTAAQSGMVFIDTQGSGTTTFTLPAAATAGLEYTFVCGDAAGEILVNVQTGDNVVGKTHGAENGSGIATAANTGIKNTAASNVKGDFCTLSSDGLTTWYMTSVAGVWASQ